MSCFRDLLVLLKRQANWLVPDKAIALFKKFVEPTRCPADCHAEANWVEADEAEGETLIFETRSPRKRSHTPVAQSKRTKKHVNGCRLITVSGYYYIPIFKKPA